MNSEARRIYDDVRGSFIGSGTGVWCRCVYELNWGWDVQCARLIVSEWPNTFSFNRQYGVNGVCVTGIKVIDGMVDVRFVCVCVCYRSGRMRMGPPVSVRSSWCCSVQRSRLRRLRQPCVQRDSPSPHTTTRQCRYTSYTHKKASSHCDRPIYSIKSRHALVLLYIWGIFIIDFGIA